MINRTTLYNIPKNADGADTRRSLYNYVAVMLQAKHDNIPWNEIKIISRDSQPQAFSDKLIGHTHKKNCVISHHSRV